MEKQLKVRILSKNQVISLGGGDMENIIKDIENILSLHDKGDVISPNKAVMVWGKTPEDEILYGRINAMPAYVGGSYDMPGIKWIGSDPNNLKLGFPRASATIILNDRKTKQPIAFMDGTTISAKRTGAVSGVAIKYLAKENAEVLTIIGAGVQGRTQLEAALIARPSIKDIYINDLFFEKAKEFASQMGEKLNRTIIPVENAAECSKKSDIIITVTLSTTPIVEADWLKPGALYLNLADNECTYEAVRKCDKIVVDTWENIKHRKVSTISLMYDDGLLEDSEIYAEIGEIINGKKPGRENDTEIIYFNAVGMGIEDIGIAAGIYRKAVEQNIGTEVIWWEDCK